MWRTNHVYILALLTVVHASTYKAYYIIPSTGHNLCRNYPSGSCFTIAHLTNYPLHLPQDTHLTLSFLPGMHSLTHQIRLTHLLGVTLNTVHENISTNLTPLVFDIKQGNATGEVVKINCNGRNYTGFILESLNTLTLKGLVFQGCTNVHMHGGAFSISRVKSVTIMSCSFISNHALGANGGAVYIEQTKNVYIHNSIFSNNSVSCSKTCEGGAIYITMRSIIEISLCILEHNTATGNGGAIGLYQYWAGANQTLKILDSSFTCNSATIVQSEKLSQGGQGGAVMFRIGSIMINRTFFANNSADNLGGAVYLNGDASFGIISTFHCSNSSYMNNYAGQGGAIGIWLFTTFMNNNIFQTNSATRNGGAVQILGNTLNSSGDLFVGNRCQNYGGAINSNKTPSNISNGYFLNNKAKQGAGIYNVFPWKQEGLEIESCTFSDNHHTSDDTGALHTIQGIVTFSGKVVFTENFGAFYSSNSQVNFEGKTFFKDNFSNQGGGISCVQGILTFQAHSSTQVSNNRAVHGGGISLRQCIIYMMGEEVISSNKASNSGGGVYTIQSTIVISMDLTSRTRRHQVHIANNTAAQTGGGMAFTASSLAVSDTYMYFTNNTAGQNGGALYLQQTSNIEIRKRTAELYGGTVFLKLEFSQNIALEGGAIYIADYTNTKELCDNATSQNVNTKRCFLQSIEAYFGIDPNTLINNLINIWFRDNAAERGGDIYGGLLDRCTINPMAEFALAYPQNMDDNGLKYLQAIASFESQTASHISSDVVMICFCDANDRIDCNKTNPAIQVQKGESFMIPLVPVDQTQIPIKATVLASLVSRIGHLKGGQQSQQVFNKCTKVTFNVYSLNDSATLQLYPEGPCGNQGISKREVNITFLPCISPVGFQRSPLSSDCAFECDHRLSTYISNCSIANQTVQIQKNVWIKYIDNGYIIHSCPYDYCVNRPVNVTLSTQEGTDKQCAFSRTGKLCGRCAEGLSLVFASSRCWECTNSWLLLLIPLALTGVLLVVVVLLLHKAVDSGALHGLLLYANILLANHSIYNPIKQPTFLTIFVSWLNLDFGIETCFYKEMTSTAKELLQLVFPVYIFTLMGLIIIVVNVTDRGRNKVSKLLSKGKPVEGLCMLILLSYSKLLKMVITSLQFTTLNYPNGKQEIVWLYDANVLYFSKDHFAQFILSIAIIIIGILYTGLLLFSQCLIKCLTNTRYKTIMEAHHHSLIERYRYWIGLLLLIRIVHYMISSFTDNSATVLSAGIIALGLLCFKLFHALYNRLLKVDQEIQHLATYKNIVTEVLEISFLVNLGVLSLGTLYVESSEEKSTQLILVNLSMAIAFLFFLTILASSIALNIKSKEFYYYKWECILAKIKSLQQLLTQSQQAPIIYQRMENIASRSPSPGAEEQYYPDIIQNQEPYTGSTQASTDDDTTNFGPHQTRFGPPIITPCRPAETSTELREELLAETKEGDVQVKYTRRAAKPICTHQEVEVNALTNIT